MKNTLIAKVLCALICLTLSVSASKAAEKPNNLLIVADDVFWLGIQK
jgi:hypothetical protein